MIKVCKKFILELLECYTVVFYYDILYKFLLVLFLVKFNEFLKDIYLGVYFNRFFYIYEIFNYMKNI